MNGSNIDRNDEIYHLRKFQSSISKKIFARAARHNGASYDLKNLKLYNMKIQTFI